jgi:hypothetical protein
VAKAIAMLEPAAAGGSVDAVGSAGDEQPDRSRVSRKNFIKADFDTVRSADDEWNDEKEAVLQLQRIPLTWRHIPHAGKSCCILEG